MTLKTVASTLVLLALVSTAPSSAEENCAFHNGHLERAIFEFLGKLPAVRPETFDKAGGDEDGLNITEFRMVGLNSLRPFGPFLTFCRDGSKVVQFDLVNEEPLRIIGAFTPPKDGKPHELETKALLARITSQLRVEGMGENVKLHPKGNLPVSLVGLSLEVEGFDEDTNDEITASISHSKPGFLNTMWNGMLFYVLEKVFNEILEK